MQGGGAAELLDPIGSDWSVWPVTDRFINLPSFKRSDILAFRLNTSDAFAVYKMR